MKHLLFFILLISVLSASTYAQRDEDVTSDERLANQYMREGEFEKALVLFEELFEKAPTPIIYNNYLQCLIELGEFRRAERLVEQQIRDNPGRWRFQVDLGFVYDKAGDSRKSRRHFDSLIRSLSAHPPSVNDLANAFIFREYFDRALETYLHGRSMLGNSYPFNLQIAAVYSRRGEHDKMMTEYIDLISLDDSHIENVQGLLQDELNNDPDFRKSDALRRVLLERSQRDASKTIYPEMLLWLSLQQKDFRMALRQARILDRRMDQDGQLVIEVAKLSAANQQFDISREGFQYIINFGDLNPFYLEARIGILNVKYQQATTGYGIDYDMLQEVESEYHQAINEMGIRAQTVTLIRNLANLKAFYLNNTKEAAELLRSVIDLPNVSNRVKAECRIELADILLLQGDLWDAHLLYAQVDKTFRDDPLAHEARYKNARLSFYMGEFKWAKAQLDVIKAATSRLIANDAMALSLLIQDNLEQDGSSVPLELFARAEMHVFMNNFDQALDVLDSLQKRFPTHRIMDNVLMSKAEIKIRTGKYHDADDHLSEITELYSAGLLASHALFMRAQLYEDVFKDKDEAMRLYQQLIVDYPGSIYTITARNRFRYLRGDLVN
jgi:tetratricopeptide (TPR) repeat protein